MKIRNSPWGAPDSEKTIADGLIFVSTPSHGGFYLSPDRWATLKEKFPDFQPFNGNIGWLEEDSDWAMAALAFPEYFKDEEICDAIRMADAWIKTIEVPKELRIRAAAPKLLAALQNLLAEYLMRDPSEGHISRLALEQADVAIAMANGVL